MSTNRPQFWLQIRKDYIFDNFENLISYLRQYTYTPAEEHPDYNATLECMTVLSEEIGNTIRDTPYYRPLELHHGVDKTIRLFCATIMASIKAGITAWSIISSLIDLLMKSLDTHVSGDILLKIYNLQIKCIRKSPLVSCGFSWDDIMYPEIASTMLLFNLTKMKFHEPGEDQPNYFVENHGLLLVPHKGLIRLTPMNRHTYQYSEVETQFILPDFLRVDMPKKEYEKVSDFDELYKITSRIISAMDQMQASPQSQPLKTYTPDSEAFIVRITSKRGLRVDAVTVDPTYRQVSGKVLLKMPPKRPSMTALNSLLEEGDYLYVHLCEDDDDFRFEVIDAFEDYYREYVCNAADKTRLAIFSTYYAKGTEWITQDGMRLGIDNTKADTFDEEELRVFNDAIATRKPVELRLYYKAPDKDKDTFFAYASLGSTFQSFSEEEHFTQDQAEKAMLESFLKYCHEAGYKIEDNNIFGNFEHVDSALCVPLISLLSHVMEQHLQTTCARLEFITAGVMLCKLLSRTEEVAYLEHERKFLYSEVMFAQNKPIVPLTHDPSLDGLPEIERHEQIIDTLSRYHHKEVSKFGYWRLRQGNVMETVSALVDASNSLIDIIDDSERNNIKQAIARTLNVEDEYVSILDERTFYGTEGISLEFKSSVVFPPANRRRFASYVADPDMQKWAIIKAICGFLNSRSGGELLLGVNDAGYAVGLDDDLRKLHELRIISSPDADHYRNYLQLMLDRSFIEPDPKVSSSDITQTYLTYNIEENAEGKTIMRIQVRPYRKDLVSMASPASDRPQGVEDSYVRLSGRTVPVTPVILSEIRKYKTNK